MKFNVLGTHTHTDEKGVTKTLQKGDVLETDNDQDLSKVFPDRLERADKAKEPVKPHDTTTHDDAHGAVHHEKSHD